MYTKAVEGPMMASLTAFCLQGLFEKIMEAFMQMHTDKVYPARVFIDRAKAPYQIYRELALRTLAALDFSLPGASADVANFNDTVFFPPDIGDIEVIELECGESLADDSLAALWWAEPFMSLCRLRQEDGGKSYDKRCRWDGSAVSWQLDRVNAQQLEYELGLISCDTADV